MMLRCIYFVGVFFALPKVKNIRAKKCSLNIVGLFALLCDFRII